jgi:hypothetical protein
MVPTLDEIIHGAVETVRALSLGPVDTQEDGASAWSRVPQPDQTYWIVSHFRSERRQAGSGGASPGSGLRAKVREVVIDVWMPWSFERDTATTHRQRYEAALRQLTIYRGLGVCARMLDLPGLVANVIEPYSSPNQGDTPVMCHHAKLVFTVVNHRPVSGS